MKRNARKAFNALKKAGISVREEINWGSKYTHFEISGENGDLNGLDYWANSEGSDLVNNILSDNGLYFEWYNPGVACVYDA